ncbi:MAG: class I SAM-dependent methyltransferase [Acidobacteria bacterium]|nr:class I SAM-dependent methyltransferase [Acidobacteriota bacterium]
MELSREGESLYLQDHALSLWHNIEAIRDALGPDVTTENPNARILDIGASPLTLAYRAYFGARTSTLDLTALLAQRFERNGISHRVCNLLNEPFPFDAGSFDVVVLTEVLEHLPTGPGRVFREINRVLLPGGHLVFSLPNLAQLRKRITSLRGRAVLEPVYDVFKESEGAQSSGSGEWVHGFGHVREYTLRETCDLVEHYGLAVVRSSCVDSTTSATTSIGGRVRSTIAEMAKSMIPNSRSINLVLARKNPS